MLGKTLQQPTFFKIILIFPRKQDLTFMFHFIVSDNLHEISDPVFRKKNKKNIISLSAAKFALRVIKVKQNIFIEDCATCFSF